MKILITGAKGKIGKTFVDHGAIPISADIRNKSDLKDELLAHKKEGEFVLIHAASKTDVDWCEKKENHRELFDVNVLGVNNVMEAVGEKNKVIYLSSCHVFDGDAYFPYSERHKPNPSNKYGFTKFEGEAVMSSFPYNNRLVLRLGTIYNQDDIEKITKQEEPIPVFMKRNFLHVEDLVRIVTQLAEVSQTSFPEFRYIPILHVGNPNQNFPVNLFYNMVRDKHGIKPVATRKIEGDGFAPRPYRAMLDVGKMVKILGKGFKFTSL